MKKIIVLILLVSQSLLAKDLLVNCTTTERYNQQRYENHMTLKTSSQQSSMISQVAVGESNIRFVAYYSSEQSVIGARIIDDNLGTQSGNFIDPKIEKAQVKVRYIKSKPEMQLFAIDCIVN